MSQYAPKVYKYDLLNNADFTVEQFGALEICGTYDWSLSWWTAGALDSDKFKIALEYSNDGVHWDFYTCCTVVDNCLKGAFFSDSLPFLFLRIHTDPETVEPGATISAKLVLKFSR